MQAHYPQLSKLKDDNSFHRTRFDCVMPKIDGIPFRDDDPDFVSCDIIQKEALVVMLTNLPRTPTFYVYTDGKITRKGVAESDTTEFELLKIVYDIIKQETSQ